MTHLRRRLWWDTTIIDKYARNPSWLTTLTAQKSSSGNRWTHFGARLRPLISPGVGNTQLEHQTAADSKSPVAVAFTGNNGYGTQQTTLQDRRAPLVGNDLGDKEDLDDDQDNEALLYKMMQQQSFLMSPSWQEQSQVGQNRVGQNEGSNLANLLDGNGNENEPGQLGLSNNSKKVIKLLKSYSHIHQVDDSDDQIRGTNTRQASRRPVNKVSNGLQAWSTEPTGRARAHNNPR